MDEFRINFREVVGDESISSSPTRSNIFSLYNLI
jgi:hypothetical protein